MPEWDVSPSGVRGVLAITQGVGAEFDTHLEALQGDLNGGATQSASEPITAALTGWLDVQRPNLEATIKNDIVILKKVAGFAERFPQLNENADWAGMLREFDTTVHEEMDYIAEARMLT